MIVERFRDPAIGAVSSEDRFITNDGRIAGEGAYVRYEMWLRRLEGSVNSLVGLSGSFFAVRRVVAANWDDSIPSDFACAMNTVRSGMVAVSDPRVIGIYKDVKDPAKEFPRKVRTAIRGMTALGCVPEVMNPFRYGVFAFQVMSHKVCRWLVPWFLIGGFLTSALLATTERFYAVLLAMQVIGYGIAAVAHVSPLVRSLPPVRIGYFFVQVNAALLKAAIDYLRGVRVVTWSPSVRA
jgi:hypothetical protein